MVAFPDELREAHNRIVEEKVHDLLDSGVGSIEKKALADAVLGEFSLDEPSLYSLMEDEGPSIIVQILTDRWVLSRKGKLRLRDSASADSSLESSQRLYHLIPAGDSWELKYILGVTRQEAGELASEYDKRVRTNTQPRNWWLAVVNYMEEHGFAPDAPLGDAFYVDTEKKGSPAAAA